jgi:hypothetical protein
MINARKPVKEKELDRVFSLSIRSRDKRCLRCGTSDNLQCAHIFSRTARSVRWYPLNALTLCIKCHLYWAHRNPVEFVEFVRELLGDLNYKILRKMAAMTKKWSEKGKRDLLTRLNGQIPDVSIKG